MAQDLCASGTRKSQMMRTCFGCHEPVQETPPTMGLPSVEEAYLQALRLTTDIAKFVAGRPANAQ